MQNLKKPIKVLFISHSSRMAGAETSLLLLLKNINRKHFEPVVALPGPGPLKEELNDLHIKTYDIKSPLWLIKRRNFIWPVLHALYCMVFEPIALPGIYNIIRHEKIDLVYTNTAVNFSGAIISFITKKPHIWHIREIIPGNPDLYSFLPNKLLFKLILKLSNNIIANSEATASQFQYPGPLNKIKVVYNAIDFNEFENPLPFPDIDGATQNDWLAVLVGSFQEGKAQDDAIQAVKIAKETIPNIKLLLIGEGNREHINHLRKMAIELDIFDNVIFTGYRKDVPQILSCCKVLLIPSYIESFGRTAVEAMAAGIPVVGTNSGGLKEILQEGITGFIVPPRNPLELANKIIHLYNHPEQSQKIVENAKRIAKDKFNVNNCVHNIEKVFAESFPVT
jgi:glycosyltransferase involved in cell wall biosynthesis